jgi:AraC-like DNA-binding protein
MTEAQLQLWGLLRRAVSVLDRDCSEAWRCLWDAYTLLGQEASNDFAASVARPVRAGGLAAWQTRRVRDYIEEHLGGKLTIEDIAAAIGLSKSHFSRAFKATLGTSPMAYVAARRIEHAKQMMVASTGSLAEVAVDCGFADQSHLNRQFRRVVGVTPGQWRRSSPVAPGTLMGGRQRSGHVWRNRTGDYRGNMPI